MRNNDLILSYSNDNTALRIIVEINVMRTIVTITSDLDDEGLILLFLWSFLCGNIIYHTNHTVTFLLRSVIIKCTFDWNNKGPFYYSNHTLSHSRNKQIKK